MRVRTYGLLLLIGVSILPLAIYGSLALSRAQQTSAAQVIEGNRRAAHAIAGRIAAYLASERLLVAAIGSAVWHAHSAHERQLVLDAYALDHSQLHDMVVYDAAGQRIAGRVPDRMDEDYQAFAGRALAGEHASSEIASNQGADNIFSHWLTIGEPIEIAGQGEGAIVARYDLVGIWPAVNSVRVGESGTVRLLATDGDLLAHGDPEERRYVFQVDRDADRALLAGALLHRAVDNRQGDAQVAAIAMVPGFPAMVVVEQPVSEAYADIRSLQRNLIILALAVLAVALALGLAFGRSLVRGLEVLRRHTRELASNLKRRLVMRSRLVELGALANALNDMASALDDERQQARARDRLTTFARVAAGLAHDLRMPIEAVRSAVELSAERPDDRASRYLLSKVRSRDLPRLKRFVDDLNRLAHEGNLGLEYEPVTPLELLSEIRTELEAAPKWGGVSFEVVGDASPATLDKNLVRRALLNLAGNAAEACLELGPGGTVYLEMEDREDETLIDLRVRDTGVGIPAERLASVENSDFQSTKRTSGVGLGLGVVRQVIAAHGGSLLVSSKEGVGSAFTMRLPRTAAPKPLTRDAPDSDATTPPVR
ncbi:sensor histidine kinase [Haliangium ochraceum]|uniref:histidine kinase n=1 Tax=Haliangium ochraceum (strain DSM 14365 / JCM 11303 / SMP-2) TaxID=502025 RepID=D0LM69_HALO1|nr:sensor histidine kinase [Haliangium ochraceum]ACY16775.1 integral membrane sensor signal transduction histidine kinase [Haliangium ochraceum DSM 14365]